MSRSQTADFKEALLAFALDSVATVFIAEMIITHINL